MSKPRRGMALLVVMVIVTLVALAAYGFNQQMTDAYRSSQLQIERAQARLTALSAIESLRVSLEQPRGIRLAWHRSAPETFTAVPLEQDIGVSEDDESQWSFSVLAPAARVEAEMPSETSPTWRFGLTNESTKINLMVLNEWAQAEPGQATKALMNLPGMDLAMAQALMRAYEISDTASASSTGLGDRIGAFDGGNGDSMGTLSGPSSGDNDAAQLTRKWAMRWTGGDWDHNYQLDSLEMSLLGEPSSVGQSGAVTLPRAAVTAWRDYLTFDSGQRNESLTGRPRVFLNGSDLQKLHQDLLEIWPADWANFVIAMRQFGSRSKSTTSGDGTAGSASLWTPDFSIPATVRISSGLELMDATVQIPQTKEEPLLVRSPFSDGFADRSDYIKRLVDDVTVHPGSAIVGQVDVMEAPRPVLLGVPSMTTEIADQIITRRTSGSISMASSEAARDTIAWLLVENVVDLPTFLKLQPWITVGGDCYHAQIVAFRDPLSPTFRCTVTLDGSDPHIAVRNFRQWDAWDKGFNITDLRGEPSPKTNLDHAGSHLP